MVFCTMAYMHMKKAKYLMKIALLWIFSICICTHAYSGDFVGNNGIILLDTDTLIYGGSQWFCAGSFDQKLTFGNMLLRNIKTGDTQIIWKPERTFYKLSAAPKQGISVLEIAGSNEKTECIFRVLKLDGSDMYPSIPNVQEYTWSPDGTSIAYSTGKSDVHVETDYDGTYIKNLITNVTTKMDVIGYDLYWASFDNNVYMKNVLDMPDHVLMYSTKDGMIHSTRFTSTNFSSDETYYFPDFSLDAEPLRVFLREKNQDVVATERCPISTVCAWGVRPVFWISDNLLLLTSSLANDTQELHRKIVFNVKKGEIRRANFEILQACEHDTKILCRNEACEFVFQNYADLEVLTEDYFKKHVKPPEIEYQEYLRNKTSSVEASDEQK